MNECQEFVIDQSAKVDMGIGEGGAEGICFQPPGARWSPLL